MKKPYKLECLEWNSTHVKFGVFDPLLAHCGILTVLTADVRNFIQNSWNGDVFWNGKMPGNEQDDYPNTRYPHRPSADA